MTQEEDVTLHARGIDVTGPFTLKLTITDGAGNVGEVEQVFSDAIWQEPGDTSPRESFVAHNGQKAAQEAYRALVHKLMLGVPLKGELGRVWRATLVGGRGSFTGRKDLL